MNDQQQRPAPETTRTLPENVQLMLPAPKTLRLIAMALAVMVLSSMGTISTLSYLEEQQIASVAAAATTTEEPKEDPFEKVSLTGRAAYVLDVTHNKVLFAQHADEQLPLASLTKLALATVAAEELTGNETFTVSERAVATEGWSELMPGQQLSVNELLDLTLVASVNDAAATLAEGMGPHLRTTYPQLAGESNPAVARMNERVKELGLSSMYYVNETGLDASTTMSGGYGSAQDVARLLAHITLNYPQAVSGTTYSHVYTSATTSTVENTNNALSDIPGLMGGKTGFTDLAGGNLAVIFDAGINRPVAVVVLGSTYSGRFRDVEQLVAAAQLTLQQGE